jgi:hypothetical protein
LKRRKRRAPEVLVLVADPIGYFENKNGAKDILRAVFFSE